MRKQMITRNLARVELKKLLDNTKLGDFGRFINIEKKVRNLNFRVSWLERKVGLVK